MQVIFYFEAALSSLLLWIIASVVWEYLWFSVEILGWSLESWNRFWESNLGCFYIWEWSSCFPTFLCFIIYWKQISFICSMKTIRLILDSAQGSLFQKSNGIWSYLANSKMAWWCSEIAVGQGIVICFGIWNVERWLFMFSVCTYKRAQDN